MRYFLLLAATFFYLSLEAQKINSHYRLQIRKAISAIKIDGEMTEPGWLNTDTADGFFMVLPMDTSHEK